MLMGGRKCGEIGVRGQFSQAKRQLSWQNWDQCELNGQIGEKMGEQG